MCWVLTFAGHSSHAHEGHPNVAPTKSSTNQDLMSSEISRSRAVFKDGKFVSPFGSPEKTFGSFLKWQWQRLFSHPKAKWPDWVGSEFEFKGLPNLAAGELDVTFINHATVLIRVGLNESAGQEFANEFRILTDPIWSHRASPVGFLGPARVRPPGVSWDQLPKIDLVVVSHNHYDHFDLPTLRRLSERDRPQFLVPLGDAELLREHGVQRVREMDWWDVEDFEWSQNESRIEAQFVPAHHWSARGITDRLRSLWGGYAFKIHTRTGETKILFAGDTGYAPHFTELRKLWGVADLAILPVGAYEPRWFMQAAHMNPSDAVKAALDLQARQVLAIHYRCFQLTDESMEQPEVDLRRALTEMQFPDEKFWRLKEGETRRVSPQRVREKTKPDR
jgi:L-ascorbate metabolism protein UlaG (beta-lactamase superfamily)